MGAFFLIRDADSASRAEEVLALEECMRKQGFAQPTRIDRPDFSLRLYPKIASPTDNHCVHADGSISFCTGTLLFQGCMGTGALKRFRDAFDGRTIPWADLGGHYCLGFEYEGCLNLLIDPLGIYKVYHDREDRVFSSSFLTVLESQRRASLDSQAVYEYVFEGTTYGNKTIVDCVRLLDTYTIVQITDRVSRLIERRSPWKPVRDASLDDHIELHSARLREWFGEVANCFGSNMTLGLSGGRDSRLMLAILQDRGVQPEVYVYGQESDVDVRVAREIAAGEGFEIDWIDRQAVSTEPDRLPLTVEENYYSFDGLPFRGVFDNGTDLQTRLKRCGSGQLMLNATAAEIYRLTYEYADVTLTLPQFLRRYFCDFTPGSCTSAFCQDEYLSNIGRIISEVSPHDEARLSAIDTEHIYLDLRCRFWGARNTSLNNRFSHALTPFLHLPVVTESVTLPFRYRVYGLFLGRLIREFSPSLAKYTSEYGHDFLVDPTFSRRVKDVSLYYRKAYLPWLNSFRIKQRLKRDRSRPAWLGPAALGAVIDTDFPWMRQYFNVDCVTDNEQFGRVCTLEYFCEQNDPKLSGSSIPTHAVAAL